MTAITAQEFLAQMLIEPRLMNEMADEDRRKTVQRMLHGSMVQYLVVNGAKAVESHTDVYSDPSMRGAVEINSFGEAIPEWTLISLIGRMEREQAALMNAMEKVNSVSWWRFLWLKFRGRKLVSYG